MRVGLGVLALLASMAVTAGARRLGAATYAVAPGGDDAAAGTEAAPFRTLQRAATVMRAGDRCVVREGVYRETVRPAASGAAGQPLRFEAYPGEHPLVAGTDRVTGAWQCDGAGTCTLPRSQPVRQLFAGGVQLLEARWPNAGGATTLTGLPWGTATGGSTTTLAATTLPASNWTGALVHVVPGEAWVSYTRRVVAWDAATKTMTFDRPVNDVASLVPQAGDAFFVYGVQAALDAPGEWFHDRAAQVLYLRPPAGVDPNAARIEVKVRDLGFDLTGLSFVEIRGFGLFGAGIGADGSQEVVVDDCHLRYPDAFRERDGYSAATPSAGAVLGGSAGRWTRSSIRHTWEAGLLVRGQGHQIADNLIDDVNGAASNAAGIEVGGGDAGSARAIEITRNTVRASGRFAVSFYGAAASIIANNAAEQACLLTLDCGIFYTWNTDGEGTAIHHNWLSRNAVHYSGGIYLDDSSRNYVVHHNLVTEVRFWGIHLKAANDIVNNTVVAPADARDFTPIQVSESLNNLGPVDLSRSAVKNNLLRAPRLLQVRLSQPSITDYAYYEARVLSSADWTTVAIPFTTFAQPSWGARVPLTLASIDQVLWSVTAPSTYTFSLDNITLGSGGPVLDDFEDGNTSNARGGAWVAAADANSRATFSLTAPGAGGSRYAATVTGSLAAGGWVQGQTLFPGGTDFSGAAGITFDCRAEGMDLYGTPPTLAIAAANADCPVDARARPTTSCAIDAGVAVAGITEGYAGAAPDIGAFESGAPEWTAGTSTGDGFVYPAEGNAGTGGAGGARGTGGAGGPGSGGTTGGAGGSGTGGTTGGAGGSGTGGTTDPGASGGGKSGCGCTAAGAAAPAWALPSLALLALAAGSRRRRRRPPG